MGRKGFSKEVKLAVVQELESGKATAEVCREYGVKQEMARRWHREYEANPQTAFSGNGNANTIEAKYARLERTVGQLYLENDFLKKALNTLQAKLAELKNER